MITKNLYLDQSCLLENSCITSSGEVELTPSEYSTRIINYGDTTCDCNVWVTLNDSEYFVVIEN